MKPEKKSFALLGMTRSKAKMYEYNVPTDFHIDLTKDPAKLLSLTIGILGDFGKSHTQNNSDGTIQNVKDDLLFVAQFFDSYIESKLNSSYKDYFLMIGAAAYYFAELPGSASVLINRIKDPTPNIEGGGLEQLLIGLIKQKTLESILIQESIFAGYLEVIIERLYSFRSNGGKVAELIESLDSLCNYVYSNGSPRQLLIADVIRATLKKQIFSSTWRSLPRYTNSSLEEWKTTILKSSFIKEFWPSQKLLGEKGVFKGNSAIVQMPTSAGKTKSTEIIIRSSFLSKKSTLAIIIAPFRALCTEIRNDLQIAFKNEPVNVDEPSDAFQNDFESFLDFDSETSQAVLILTPEKFMYMLRSTPELAKDIGLLIYDEGHQFDNGIRGVTYELLLSSLKSMVPTNAQIVLISAVISNAEAIGDWLITDSKEIIKGLDLSPTYRTIAFVSWKKPLGMLQFVKPNNPNTNDFFVPRVIEQIVLQLKGKERKERLFPEKDDGRSIALFLSLKLIENGPVAIFCGSKKTVKSLCQKTVELKSRNYDMSTPLFFSNKIEAGKLTNLHAAHFGEESYITKSSALGIFAHSGNTPQGLRLAIEYGMQKGTIKFVICTSTLAQGVNLPIKYLLIPSFYQAQQQIKTRDFHNLIGRAGRSGIHTEGSIIFTDRDLFDKKETYDNWKWKQAIDLLNPLNSEPCGSTLLTIFEPLKSDNKILKISFDLLDFTDEYTRTTDFPKKYLKEIRINHSDRVHLLTGLEFQIDYKIRIISAIESFLMAHWDKYELNLGNENIMNLVKETLAYYLSSPKQKNELVNFFKILADNIKSRISDQYRRNSFSKTLFGVKDIIEIENWTISNKESIDNTLSVEDLLDSIWSILYKKSSNVHLKKLTPLDSGFALAKDWIKGTTYLNILENLNSSNVKIKAGKQKRILTQENIIEICENAFTFDITLIIAAISEVLKIDGGNEILIDRMNHLQKMIKYGLPNELSIAFYEIGFADRIIAMDLALNFSHFYSKRKKLIRQIKKQASSMEGLLAKYPNYYLNQLDIIVNN